jgi:PAS domain S-box-containing protein
MNQLQENDQLAPPQQPPFPAADDRYSFVLNLPPMPAAGDVRAALQKHLRLVAVMATAGFACWFGLGLLRWHASWLRDPWSVFYPPGYGKALPLLCLEGILAILLTRRLLSLRALRVVEWLIIAPLAVFFADKDCMNIGRVPLEELTRSQGTFANDSAVGWVVLMVGYGTLIPSTWQRCAAVFAVMGLCALIPASVALGAKDMPSIPMAQYLGLKAMWLAVAALIATYGSHRLQLFREKLESTLQAWLADGGVREQSPLEVTPDIPATAGRYRLEGEVAHGGMGIIFRGYDPQLGRRVAIKTLRARHRNNLLLVQLFLDEARIVAQAHHPGIVPIYEVGQLADARPYFAMKLVKGETLDELLRQRKQPAHNLAKFVHIFEQVCQTIAYTHTQGVIHRDLKPANVMVGAFGEVMVMDWGIAKVLAGDEVADADMATAMPTAFDTVEIARGEEANTPVETSPGMLLGTLYYMSPEQANRAGALDERTDVFSLGAILCVILTGQPPYTGNNVKQLHLKARQADLGDAFARLDACSADRQLVALAKRCMAANPKDRPRDGGEVLRELKAYLDALVNQPERDLVRFFELSLDMFCIAGLNGYFHRVNANFSRVLGYTDQELLSRPFLDFVHVDDREKTVAEMKKLSLGLPVVHFENRYRDVRGNYRRFDWTAKSIPEEGVIFAVAREVTDCSESNRNSAVSCCNRNVADKAPDTRANEDPPHEIKSARSVAWNAAREIHPDQEV